jgi:hypothetical protein
MGILVCAIHHGYWLQVAATHPQRLGQPDAVKGGPAPVGYGGIGQEIEAMAHRSARLSEPLGTIQALERYERRALSRRKWASRAFSEAVAIMRSHATSGAPHASPGGTCNRAARHSLIMPSPSHCLPTNGRRNRPPED